MSRSLGPPRGANPGGPDHPRALPSGHLLAALALLVLAPPAILGWVAGTVVVRCGWVSRRRLSAAGTVTGALALVVIGPLRAAGGILQAVAALGGVLGPATLTIGAVLGRGPRPPPRRAAGAVPPSRLRRPRGGLEPSPGLPSWRRGRLLVPPAGQLGLTTLLVGAPGSGKTTASERLAYLAARERRSLFVIDGKGTDGLDEASAAAMLSAWPEARIAAFPQRPVDLWDASPQQLANRLVAAWQFSDEAEFYEQAAMLGLRCALTAPGPPARSTAELVTRLDPGWLERAWQGHQGTLSLIQGPMKGRPGRCPPSGPRTWRPAWGRPGMGTGGWTTSRGHLHPAHHPGERQGQRRGHAGPDRSLRPAHRLPPSRGRAALHAAVR